MSVLCAAAEIGDGQARGFVVGAGAERRDVVVVNSGGVLRGFVNRCPHRGTPLETFPDRFTDSAGLLVCSTHGARFRPDDGLCVSGPCAGQSLQPVVLELRDGILVLAG
jgi:nitrite reductase/ring-hydroxylating ferredoxin subunit